MWYFTWILGLGLALAFGIINVMWLEASYAFGDLDEEQRASDSSSARSSSYPARGTRHLPRSAKGGGVNLESPVRLLNLIGQCGTRYCPAVAAFLGHLNA